MSGVAWTDEMLAALLALRAQGEPGEACAERIGVGEHTVWKKMRELGLNQRLNRGRRAGYIQ